MALGWIPAYTHHFSRERVLALQFAAAIFRQNDFHGRWTASFTPCFSWVISVPIGDY